MVLLSIGIRPNKQLAVEAGLKIGERGGITVNEYLQTSDADIYAAGDAIEVAHPLLNHKTLIPLAGPANKQGRIVADNLVLGNKHVYHGTLGTWVVKVFDLTVAATGLSEKLCREESIPCRAVVVHPQAHASYYPGSGILSLKLLFAPDTGKVLGAQAVGRMGVEKRIDVLATAIQAGMTVYDLTEIEHAYAPPYSSAKDPIHMAGFVAENVLQGRVRVVTWEEALEADRMLTHFLDVRTNGEYHAGHIEGAQHIPLDDLRQRLQIEAEHSGVLIKILKKKGEKVPVGTVVGQLTLENESMADLSPQTVVPAAVETATVVQTQAASSTKVKRLVVIGGGSGGYMAALKAAQKGAEVTLITKGPLGGTCLHTGCMPTKAYLSRARILERVHLNEEFAGRDRMRLDLDILAEKTRESIRILELGIKNLLGSQGVKVIYGSASFASATQVEILNEDGLASPLSFDACIIATGSRPNAIRGIEANGEMVHTTDTIWKSRTAPNRVLIVGSGAVGLEFASFYNAIGSKVHIIEMLPEAAPHMDREVAGCLVACLNQRGVAIEVKKRLSGVETVKQEMLATVEDENGSEQIPFDLLLLAAGRTPVTDTLGLQNIGLAMNGRAIAVDSRMQTNVPGVYAVGDCIGGIMLAHAAFLEAETAVDNIMGHACEINYSRVPFCTYSFPEVASVGVSEARARETCPNVVIGRIPLYANGKAQVSGENEGMVKVLANGDTGEILGAHIVAHHATELIGEFSLALSAEVTIDEAARVIKGHPTVSEALTEAALDAFGMAPHMPKRPPV